MNKYRVRCMFISNHDQMSKHVINSPVYSVDIPHNGYGSGGAVGVAVWVRGERRGKGVQYFLHISKVCTCQKVILRRLSFF